MITGIFTRFFVSVHVPTGRGHFWTYRKHVQLVHGNKRVLTPFSPRFQSYGVKSYTGTGKTPQRAREHVTRRFYVPLPVRRVSLYRFPTSRSYPFAVPRFLCRRPDDICTAFRVRDAFPVISSPFVSAYLL